MYLSKLLLCICQNSHNYFTAPNWRLGCQSEVFSNWVDNVSVSLLMRIRQCGMWKLDISTLNLSFSFELRTFKVWQVWLISVFHYTVYFWCRPCVTIKHLYVLHKGPISSQNCFYDEHKNLVFPSPFFQLVDIYISLGFYSNQFELKSYFQRRCDLYRKKSTVS